MKKSWRKAGLYSFLLFVLVSCMVIGNKKDRVFAAESEGEFANLVVFVKFQGDDRDFFNATYTSETLSYNNWDRIKKMYNADPMHDYTDGKDYDDSFKHYLSVISEGKVSVTNYFPQENAEKTGVVTYTLQNEKSHYTTDGLIISEVLSAITNGTISLGSIRADHLCHAEPGFIDNLTVIVQGNSSDASDVIHPHRAQYGGSDTVLGLRTSNYVIMPSGVLVTDDASVGTKQAQGVIAHEFLHVLGFPDLYRYGDDGVPVGMWDIMAANNAFLQYPLSYLRAKQGWVTLKWIDTPGTYTLTAVSGTGGDKVFAIKTPLSESEYIVLEYRKKEQSIYAFEHSIPSSGLLMYRVDDKVENHTNAAGKNYIYVYRPDVTDPEAGKDKNASGTLNAVYDAAIDVEAGESGYGSTDLSKSFTENTLYYSDGSNSGIQISNVTLSENKNQLTFQITFADYQNANVWDSLGGAQGNHISGTPVLYADTAGGKLYLAYTDGSGSSGQVVVKVLNESTWQQVGEAIPDASEPQLSVCAGELYLSYVRYSNQHPVYCKLVGNSWTKIDEKNVLAKNMQFVEDAANLYASYVEMMTDGRNRLTIYDVKNNKLITDTKVGREFGNPSVCKLGSVFYVAYSDFFGDSGDARAKIEGYDTGEKSWTVLHQFQIASTNCHVLKEVNGKLYAFVGGTGKNPVVSIYDGAQWVDTTVSSMSQYLDVSMDIIGDEVYLSYIDTEKNKASILRKVGSSFLQYYDNLGTGTAAFDTCTMQNDMYAITQARGAGKAYVKTKEVVLPQYPISLTPPAGYEDVTVYVDGIPYTASKNGGTYHVTLPHSNARTAVMYAYDGNQIPKGMYVWSLLYENGAYVAEELPGLKDLISYHGFSIRVQSPAGIRFKSGISESLRGQLLSGGVDGYRLVEYGTLSMTSANRSSYPFVKLGRKTASGRAFWKEAGAVNDKVFETVGGRIRFASVLTKLPASHYNTEFAFRGYMLLDNGAERILLYGPPVCRSVYTVAKQIDAKGEFKPGSSGYNYIKEIIRSVEGN